MIEPRRYPERPAGLGGLFALTSLATALGVASCCALPMLLVSMGFGAAWLGKIGGLALPYRHLLIGLSLLSLAGGGWTLLGQYRRARTCGPVGPCAPSWRRHLTLAALFGALAVLIWGASYG